MISFENCTLSHVVPGWMFRVVQILQRHGVGVGRRAWNTALALNVGLSVIILHRPLKIAGFGRVFVNGLHGSIRHLVWRLRADGLSRGFDHAFSGLMGLDRLFLESFTFGHKKCSYSFRRSEIDYAECAFENEGMMSF